ncbi:MAG: class I SAM-dependent methyltransferase [Luteimonas sp.]
MVAYVLEELATNGNFDEKAYLAANPDVAKAVDSGGMESGRRHFDVFGKREKRSLRRSVADIADVKKRKLQRIAPLLREDMPNVLTPVCYDFLTDDLRARFNIVDTDAVSANHYDGYALELIRRYDGGMVLDCGAGKRPVYFDNVVNFEIVDYDTTDVRGVGEVLPFKDETFDAVISIAVLEHVKDPFACAREIARVLKPGGQLMCCVPFLQPLHGYPHHYYNMTHSGLGNLFSDRLEIDKQVVYESVLPIWSLTWILRSWAEGLNGKAKEDFLRLRVADLMQNADAYLDAPWVKGLAAEKNLELASATVLFAHKRK